ncbi:hypothetical protein ES703_104095 [subsurface metagenome]
MGIVLSISTSLLPWLARAVMKLFSMEQDYKVKSAPRVSGYQQAM